MEKAALNAEKCETHAELYLINLRSVESVCRNKYFNGK